MTEVLLKKYRPNTLSINITDQCYPGECEHCIVKTINNENQSNTLSEKTLYTTIEEAKESGIKAIVFPGGEPFLRFDLLKKGIEKSLSEGISTVVIESNGHWGENYEKACTLLDELENIAKQYSDKLVILSLSLDEFHEKNIPLSSLANITKAFWSGHGNNIHPNMYSLRTPNMDDVLKRYLNILKDKKLKPVFREDNSKQYLANVKEDVKIPLQMDYIELIDLLFSKNIINSEIKAMLMNNCNSVKDIASNINKMGLNCLIGLDEEEQLNLFVLDEKIIMFCYGKHITLFNKASDFRKNRKFIDWYTKELQSATKTEILELLTLGSDGKFYLQPGHFTTGQFHLADTGQGESVQDAINNANINPIYLPQIHDFRRHLIELMRKNNKEEIIFELNSHSINQTEFGLRTLTNNKVITILQELSIKSVSDGHVKVYM